MKSHERKLIMDAISFLVEDYADAAGKEALPTEVLQELDFDDTEAVGQLRIAITKALGLRVEEKTYTREELLK